MLRDPEVKGKRFGCRNKSGMTGTPGSIFKMDSKIVKLIIGLVMLPAMLKAQPIEMADTMRSEGKIYVVVAILLLIFAGLIGYLIMLDRKITKIEKKLPPEN